MPIKYSYQVAITSCNGASRSLYLVAEQKKEGKFIDKVRIVNNCIQVTMKYHDPLISIQCWDYDNMICILQQSLFPIKTFRSYKNNSQNVDISILLTIDIDDQNQAKENNQNLMSIKQRSIKSEVGDSCKLDQEDYYKDFGKIENCIDVDNDNYYYKDKLKNVKSWSNLHHYQIRY